MGSEGTKFRSDLFRSSLNYIFDSLWKSKDKENHLCRTQLWPEFFLKVSCVFIFFWHDMIENLSKMSDINLHPHIWSEGTEFCSDFFQSSLTHRAMFKQCRQGNHAFFNPHRKVQENKSKMVEKLGQGPAGCSIS